MNQTEVSVVIPFHNEEGNARPLVNELIEALAGFRLELVLVDDGSTDRTAAELIELSRETEVVRFVGLPSNQGQSAALLAGFDSAESALVVMMDGDGQNDPGDAPAMIRRLQADTDLAAVAGYRVDRRDSLWKRVQSRVANKVRDLVTGDRISDTGCSLRAARREYLVRLPRFNGVHRFIPTLIRAQGGRVEQVPVTHRPRKRGSSKYTMTNRVLRTLVDAFGVRWYIRRAVRR